MATNNIKAKMMAEAISLGLSKRSSHFVEEMQRVILGILDSEDFGKVESLASILQVEIEIETTYTTTNA